jgi:CheY-like chemotaxis protein
MIMTIPRLESSASQDNFSEILVVDDEIDIAQFIAGVLEDEGYQVRIWHDGASALIDILKRRPDLVMLDITMPVMCGDEVLRTLRERGFEDLPVIVMTAGSQPERYLREGASDVLPKPFDIDDLIERVHQYVNKAKG